MPATEATQETSAGTTIAQSSTGLASSANPQETAVKNTHRVDSDDEAASAATETARLLREAREAAQELSSDFYLGVASIRKGLTWHKEGRRHHLVSKSDLAEANPDDDVTGAVLSLIVHITKRDRWLMPDASWTTSSSFGKKFADIKLSFSGCAPPHTELNHDFAVGLDNLTYLMHIIQTEGAEQMSILSQHLASQKIKFRHTPFLVRSSPSHFLCSAMTCPTAHLLVWHSKSQC